MIGELLTIIGVVFIVFGLICPSITYHGIFLLLKKRKD
jgi:hypothetical protein